MKPLQIDFAPPSLTRTLAGIDALTWLLASVALISCLFFVADCVVLLRQHDANWIALQQAITRQHQRLAQIPVVQKKSVPAAEIIAVNAAIEQLNLPWRDLLDAIERATPADIALLALEPDAAKHSLKGTAEARDTTGMIAYIRSLQGQDFFGDVALLRHETNEADTHKPIRFQFEVRWQGTAP